MSQIFKVEHLGIEKFNEVADTDITAADFVEQQINAIKIQ